MQRTIISESGEGLGPEFWLLSHTNYMLILRADSAF